MTSLKSNGSTHPRFQPEFQASNVAAPAPTAPPQRKRSRFNPTLVAAVLAVAIGTAAVSYRWVKVGRFIESTDDAYIGGNVTLMAPKVSGFISEIAVEDNQRVHAGDLLVKLDDSDYRSLLAKSEAGVSFQQAALKNLAATRNLQQAIIAQTEASIAAADAEITRTRNEQARFAQLLKDTAVSVQDSQKADAAFKQAAADGEKTRAGLTAAQRNLEVIDAQEQQINASLAQAVAERNLARLNVSYTEVRAPIDGIVGNRNAQTGAYATTGSSLIALVPDRGLWVDANLKESQLKRLRAGMPALIEVDSIPGKTLHGHVVSVAPATGSRFSILPPENATGNFTKIVQRVPVRIAFDNEAEVAAQLRPGLSVMVKINTAPVASKAERNSL